MDKPIQFVSDRHPETASVHAGIFTPPLNGASSPPLFQASSYEFDDLQDVEEIYAGRRRGGIYGRLGGPNGSQLESAVAQMEGASAAVGAAAGLSAIDAALATNLRAGDSVVVTREVYGGTFALLENDYRERGFGVHYVDQSDLKGLADALARYAPKALYVEALTNPLVHVADVRALAACAHAAGALLIVDATFATPALLAPLRLGADLVVHSVGKYIGGHGDVGAGVLAGSVEHVDAARAYLARKGATIAHFEAWLALRGLRTLALRMAKHSSNAVALAAYLARHPAVDRVYHPSLPAHPQHALAARDYPHGTGGMLAFDLAGGAPAVDAFLRALQTIAIVHSLGEVATTVSYPAVASHRPLSPQLRRALGVGDGTVRLSAGIEHPYDLIADLAHALAGLPESVRA